MRGMRKMHARKITLTGCISYMPGKIAVVEQSREKDTKLRHDCFRAELGWNFALSGTGQRASGLIFAIHRQHESVLHRFANKTIRARSASGSVSGNATSTAQRQRTNTRRKTRSLCAIGVQTIYIPTSHTKKRMDGWMAHRDIGRLVFRQREPSCSPWARRRTRRQPAIQKEEPRDGQNRQ